MARMRICYWIGFSHSEILSNGISWRVCTVNFVKNSYGLIREHFGSLQGPLRAWAGSHGFGLFNFEHLVGISKKPKYCITTCTECTVVLLVMLCEIICLCVVKWLRTKFFIIFSLAGIPTLVKNDVQINKKWPFFCWFGYYIDCFHCF